MDATDMPQTDDPDSGSFFPGFITAIEQLGQLLHLAWLGAGAGFVLGSLGNDPNSARFEKFGKEQVQAGFPLLYELATVRLDSILNAMVRNFVKRHRAERPIVKLPKQKLYGVDRHEQRLKNIGYGDRVPSEVHRALMELSATRDVIVHQLGRADDRFLQRCPWLNLKTGDAVRIHMTKFATYQRACSWYALELSLRALQAGGVEIPASREEHLESQAKMMEGLRAALGGAVAPGEMRDDPAPPA